MSDWILMIKGDEQKLVHPGNVQNHINAGWQIPDAPVRPEAAEEAAVVAVETPPAEELEATAADESSEAEPSADVDDDPS